MEHTWGTEMAVLGPPFDIVIACGMPSRTTDNPVIVMHGSAAAVLQLTQQPAAAACHVCILQHLVIAMTFSRCPDRRRDVH